MFFRRVFLIIFAVSGTAAAQQSGVSESTPYSPRVFAYKNTDKKRVSKQIEAAAQIALPEGNRAIDVNGILEIPVVALDSHRSPVTDIRASEVETLIDHALVQPISIERKTGPIRVYLMLDVSPSMTVNEKDLKTLAQSVVAELAPDDELSIVRFADDMKVALASTTDRTAAAKAIAKLGTHDGTSLYEAITGNLLVSLHNEDHNTAIILITDGVDTTSRKWQYESSLIIAERSNVPFYTVYLANPDANLKQSFGTRIPAFGSINVLGTTDVEYKIGAGYLSDLLLVSGGHTTTATSILRGDRQPFESIFSGLRNRLVVKIKVPNGHSGDRHSLIGRLKRPGLVVRARGSYIQP
jgi:Mg-chelatase subunit ChlD